MTTSTQKFFSTHHGAELDAGLDVLRSTGTYAMGEYLASHWESQLGLSEDLRGLFATMRGLQDTFIAKGVEGDDAADAARDFYISRQAFIRHGQDLVQHYRELACIWSELDHPEGEECVTELWRLVEEIGERVEHYSDKD